jgi:hypothetical protein
MLSEQRSAQFSRGPEVRFSQRLTMAWEQVSLPRTRKPSP